MEILNQGSFVPLDNRERIEQLKFTAKEMAAEVAKSEGFENNGPINQQIAVEMWKGTEYMCRAHEENTVRNIFLSSFLEGLREIAKTTSIPFPPQPHQSRPSSILDSSLTVVATVEPSPPAPINTQPPASAVMETTAQISTPTPSAPPPAEAADEFLGIVPSIEDTPTDDVQGSYTDECDSGYDPAIEALVDKLESEEAVQDTSGSIDTIDAITEEPVTAAIEVISKEESASESPASTGTSGDELPEEKSEAEAQVVDPTEVQPIGSIVLAEKEPYNFDSCTLTSVIQLLPEDNGIRKCVVSIRSHDFVPQITTSEVANDNIAEDIRQKLETAFERYRTALPALAAEKIKKEKPAAKKRTTKPAEKAKATTATAKSKDSFTAQTTPNPTAAQGQNSLFAS